MAVKKPEWDTVRLILLTLIACMWVANWVIALFDRTYKPDPTINAVFTLVAGVVFAAKGNTGTGSSGKHNSNNDSGESNG